MATYTLAPNVKRQYLDNSGNPLASGKLYTVAAGGTYPGDAVTTYQTSSGTAHTNPIVLDSSGRVSGSSEIYLEPGQSYKFIAASSSGDYLTPLWTQDGIGAIPVANVDNDVAGTAGENLTATQCVYLGGGSWSKADADLATTSTVPTIAFVVGTVASGDTGSFRLSGSMSGFSGLNPGSDYYVSATAGEITATPPANARYVGRASAVDTLVIGPNPRPMVVPQVPCGRLTLTTNVPVTTSDVTAATTLYFTPYQGNTITLYDGTRWIARTFSQVSIAVPATTTQMYDVFVYDNSGTVTLELTAWTNDTTRATALTTQDGFYVKTGAVTRLYLGSFRTTGVSGQTEDSVTKRYVSNYYNRVPRPMFVSINSNHNYTTATWRQAAANAAYQLDVVVGVQEVLLELSASAAVGNSTGTASMAISIGEDSTSSPLSTVEGGVRNAQTTGIVTSDEVKATLTRMPAVGRHFYAGLEWSTAAGTTGWFYGNTLGAGSAGALTGWIEG